MGEVSDRLNEIRYSSRTRMVTEDMRHSQYMRHILSELLTLIPEDQRKDLLPCRLAEELASNKRYNVVHLIYRNQPYEQHYKDYQFGRMTMREHWRSGLDDIRQTLIHRDKLNMPENLAGFTTYDVHRDEIEKRLASNGK
jgi:NTE family protein